MAKKTAIKTNPALWRRVKESITRSDKGGRPGQWSARKAQLASQEYQKQGGGYVGPKNEDNSLQQWTKEDWGTKSGRNSRRTGERYLPKAAREALTDREYARTSAKKRLDTERGLQYSAQPGDIAEKTARYRDGGGLHGDTRATLYAEARRRGLPGRSKMTKIELREALEQGD